MTGHVDVHLFAAARAAAGVDTITCTAGTLAQVCDQLRHHAPSLDSVLPRCSYLLDSVAVHGNHDAITVPAGSRLDVLPPFAGG